MNEDIEIRQWLEQPDIKRGTGRTTRMIDAIKVCKKKPIVVVAANLHHANFIKEQLLNDCFDVDKVVFTSIGTMQADTRGLPMGTSWFWDHSAIDIWQRREVARITRKAHMMFASSVLKEIHRV